MAMTMARANARGGAWPWPGGMVRAMAMARARGMAMALALAMAMAMAYPMFRHSIGYVFSDPRLDISQVFYLILVSPRILGHTVSQVYTHVYTH